MPPRAGLGSGENLKFEICLPAGHVPHSVLSQPITRLGAHRALNGANLRGRSREREGGRLLGTNAAGKIRQLCRSSHNCAARSFSSLTVATAVGGAICREGEERSKEAGRRTFV